MVAQNFAPSLACLNVSEGGKDDDPRDPGGRTAYGVTQARYNQYLRDKGRPRADVWGITVPEREEIWHTYYWVPCRCDDLPAGLDYVVFDGAANSGPAQSIKWLQRAINDVRAKTGDGPILVDGQMGTNTVAAVNAIDDIDAVIGFMQDRRLAMLRNLKTWPVYKNGWTTRVVQVRKLGQAVARGSVQAPTPVGWITGPVKEPAAQGGAPTSPKALPTDAAPLPSPTKGVVGGGVGVISSTIAQVQPVVSPVQGVSPWIDGAIQGLTIIGAVAALVGIGWVAYANARAKKMAAELDIGVPPAPARAVANDNDGDHPADAPGQAA